MVFNASMGSTRVLVASGIVVLLGISTRMAVGSCAKGIDTVGLTYKGGECIVVYASPAVGAGTRAASGIDTVFFLEFMAHCGR